MQNRVFFFYEKIDGSRIEDIKKELLSMKEGERMEHTFEKRKKVIYDLICDDLYVPMKLKEIAMLLQIPREQRNELKEVLEALEADGKIYVSKKGKYVKGQPQYLKGIFQANLRGFGFVLREDEEDVFIPEENINGAFQEMRWNF